MAALLPRSLQEDVGADQPVIDELFAGLGVAFVRLIAAGASPVGLQDGEPRGGEPSGRILVPAAMRLDSVKIEDCSATGISVENTGVSHVPIGKRDVNLLEHDGSW